MNRKTLPSHSSRTSNDYADLTPFAHRIRKNSPSHIGIRQSRHKGRYANLGITPFIGVILEAWPSNADSGICNDG